MAGASATAIKSYIASAAIPKRRIVRHASADNQVQLGSAATDLLIGVTTEIDVVANEPVDVIREGLADIEYGGTVTRGQPLTSDGTGRAVVAAPAAGSNVRLIGFAEVSGVVGDIGTVFISPSVMQG
jgi:hypothetical protein